MANLIYGVALDGVNYGCDILYSYLPLAGSACSAQIGQRVIVPFGRGSALRMGIILNIFRSECENNFKPIYAVLDNAPLVSPEMIFLIKWMKERYFCTYYEAAKLIFPVGIGGNVNSIKYKLSAKELSKNLLPNELEFTEKIKEFGKKSFNLKNLKELGIKNPGKILFSLVMQGVIEEESHNFKSAGEKLVKEAELCESCDLSQFRLTENQKKVCEFLKIHKKATFKEICYFTGAGISTVKTLAKKKIISLNESLKYSSLQESYNFENKQPENYILNSQQSAALENMLADLQKNTFQTELLYGVTGSGKTPVLLGLIDFAVSQGKTAIFMVPEIALTSQFVEIFKARYKNKVCVIHSGLSRHERYDSWKRIKSGEIKVVLGTRSAVFAPLDNIGVIIIDEEHEFTYKSDSSPRFSTKEVAAQRCKNHGCMLVLSSATPSVESFYKAQKGIYRLQRLDSRYGVSKLPEVSIVDMNDKFTAAGEFGELLTDALKNNFKEGKQSILFINRRGYNTFAKCRFCGEVLMCPNCSVSLNYHKTNGRLMCHYCGYSTEFIKKCPKCGKEKIFYAGTGTQKIEDALKSIIPEARILRMDSDSKNLAKTSESCFKDFYKGKYDILLGTQMISKGFNFPNVTLAGVLCADSLLYGSDFRSYEKAFALFTQVVGRAGRDKFPGRAVIQTFTPENDVLRLSANQDYVSFFESEIRIRKAMLYPPFSDICVVGFSAEKEDSAANASCKFFENLKKEAAQNYSDLPLRIFSPSPAAVKKSAGRYRYKIVIKCRNNKCFRSMISNLAINFSCDSGFRNVRVFIDVNPDKIL